MTQDQIIALDSKKHIKIWLLHKQGLTRRQIADLLGTNPGHVGNEIKAYAVNKEKREAAEALLQDAPPPKINVDYERQRLIDAGMPDVANDRYPIKKADDSAYKKASKIPKGGTVNATQDNLLAWSAETIAKKHAMQPEAIYNWAKKHGVDLHKQGHILSKVESNSALLSDVLNDKYEETKRLIESGPTKDEIQDKIDEIANSKRISYRDAFILFYGKEAGEFYDQKQSEYLGRYTKSFLMSEDGMYKSKDAREYANHETADYFYNKKYGSKLGNGGILEGPKHGSGGIKATLPDGNPIELEGGEIIINAKAAKEHCKELSKINQSTGNGVAFPCNNPALDGIQGPMAGEGAKIEAEHEDLYNELASLIPGGMPLSKEAFFEKIAKTHIKEDPDYYKKLEKYVESKADFSKKPYYLLTKEETIAERNRLEANNTDPQRLQDLCRYSYTKFKTLLKDLK